MESTDLHSTPVRIKEQEFMSDLYPNGLPTDTVKTAPYTRRRLKKEISMPYSWAGMKRK